MSTPGATESIVQEIVIRATAERIFEALTNPAERARWWGAPGRFQTRHAESDLRPGGKWKMSGAGMGGTDFTITGEYREVRRPHLLVFTWLPSWQPEPVESLVRWDLEEKDGATTVRITHSGLTPSVRESHRGWPDILRWLQTYVEQN